LDSLRWCVAARHCAVAGQFRAIGRLPDGNRVAALIALKPLLRIEKKSSTAHRAPGEGSRAVAGISVAFRTATGDFVCKCGLIQANGNAAGSSAHLTPPRGGRRMSAASFFARTIAVDDLATVLEWRFWTVQEVGFAPAPLALRRALHRGRITPRAT